MAYRIELARSAAREIRDIGRVEDRRRIMDRIQALADDPRPRGCVKIGGADAYRIRSGVFRVIYTVTDSVLLVHVVKVAHRREAYR